SSSSSHRGLLSPGGRLRSVIRVMRSCSKYAPQEAHSPMCSSNATRVAPPREPSSTSPITSSASGHSMLFLVGLDRTSNGNGGVRGRASFWRLRSSTRSTQALLPPHVAIQCAANAGAPPMQEDPLVGLTDLEDV